MITTRRMLSSFLIIIAGVSLVMLMLSGCNRGGDSSTTVGGGTTLSSTAISVSGLGESILVTDQSTATINGQSASDAGISKVEVLNITTHIGGTANGTTEWTAQMILQTGDNELRFTAFANDGSTSEYSTVLTYYPTLNLTSPLSFSDDLLYINEAKDITVATGVGGTAAKTVTLYKTNRNGTIQSDVGVMKDDGIIPDTAAGDGVYTTSLISLLSSTPGYLCYRAGVTEGTDTYFSENKCVWVTTHYTDAQIQTAVDLADLADAKYNEARLAGKSVADSLVFVANELKTNAAIGAIGCAPGGGVWWITKDGILGGYHPILDGQKSGSSGGSVGKTPVYKPKFEVIRYPNIYLNGAPALQASGTGSNEIKSTSAIIISPFVNNPGQAWININANFGAGDDYYVAWQTITNSGSDDLFATAAVINDGNVNVGLDTFKQVGDYGYIHISSHGDNLYQGIEGLWSEEWGPNKSFGGSMSKVVLVTGLLLPHKPTGGYDQTGYEDDLKLKRIALFSKAAVVILPEFVKHYVGQLRNSIVVLSSCRSLYNNSMADAFLAQGAGAVVGYSDYTEPAFAQNWTNAIVEELFKGKTIRESMDKAIADYGAHDALDSYLKLSLRSNSGLKLDDTPPTVKSTSPAAGELVTSADIMPVMTVAFSEAMDPATITPDALTLSNGVTAQSVNYHAATKTADFVLSSSLARSTQYTATIGTGVKDTMANALASPYTWTFTTGDPPKRGMGGSVQSSTPSNFSANATVATLTVLDSPPNDFRHIAAEQYYSYPTNYYPSYMTTDGTNLYVADTFGYTIRKVNISTGTVTTLAGQSGIVTAVDGVGLNASFFHPTAITTDGTNLYVFDWSAIRKVEISTGTVTTIAGPPQTWSMGINEAYGYVDGTGTNARFSRPTGITTDGTYVYVADTGSYTIRKVEISTGVVTTIAGTAGTSDNTDGVGTAATFHYPGDITTDGANLYVTQPGAHTIRKVVISTGAVTTIAGAAFVNGTTDAVGTSARFGGIQGITTDGANLYVTDSNYDTIRKIDISPGAMTTVTTIAGSPGVIGSTDGVGASALFDQPLGITADGSHLYVVDRWNHAFRKISP